MIKTAEQIKNELNIVKSRMICIQDEMNMRQNEYVELLSQEECLKAELYAEEAIE